MGFETQDATTKINLRLQGATKQITLLTIGRAKNCCKATNVGRECYTKMYKNKKNKMMR
jgi:hypothetical protein